MRSIKATEIRNISNTNTSIEPNKSARKDDCTGKSQFKLAQLGLLKEANSPTVIQIILKHVWPLQSTRKTLKHVRQVPTQKGGHHEFKRHHLIRFCNHFMKDSWQKSVLKLVPSVAWPVHAKIIQLHPPRGRQCAAKGFQNMGVENEANKLNRLPLKPVGSRRQETTTHQSEWPAARQHTDCKRRFVEVRLPCPFHWFDALYCNNGNLQLCNRRHPVFLILAVWQHRFLVWVFAPKHNSTSTTHQQ